MTVSFFLQKILQNLQGEWQISSFQGFNKKLCHTDQRIAIGSALGNAINVISVDTLRAAQEEPEKFRDLLVKVAGYNARFTSLHKALQDQIIARTEHGV